MKKSSYHFIILMGYSVYILKLRTRSTKGWDIMIFLYAQAYRVMVIER